jgi:hypothetical protein
MLFIMCQNIYREFNYFRLDQISKELEETKSFEARYREITIKYGQALIDNKNLKDANNARMYYLLIDNFEWKLTTQILVNVLITEVNL